jgi:choice-of-anchor A domain-containing protein
MHRTNILLRAITLAMLAAAPLAAVAQVSTAASNFAAELGTENAIIDNQLSLNDTHTQSGVAAGGATTIENGSILNQNSSYTDDAYSLRVYGQLTLSGGSDQSLNGGATFVQNSTTNVGLKDFSVNGGGQRVETFGSSSSSMPQIAENGNSGHPAATKFVSTPDNYFTSRASALAADSTTFANASAINPVNSQGTLTFNAAPAGITVFNWDVAHQANVSQIAINAAAGTNVIINIFDVPGGTWSPSFNFTGNAATAATASRVLWNFEGTLNLTTSREWWGSILGPDTTITGTQNFDGQIFADNLSGVNDELHYDKFIVIPEPATDAALIGLAVLTAAIARRRRLLKAGN